MSGVLGRIKLSVGSDRCKANYCHIVTLIWLRFWLLCRCVVIFNLFNFVRLVKLFHFVSISRPSVSIFVPLVALSSRVSCVYHAFVTPVSVFAIEESRGLRLGRLTSVTSSTCIRVHRLYIERLFHYRLVNYPHWLSSMSSMSTQRRLLVMTWLLLVDCSLINDAR